MKKNKTIQGVGAVQPRPRSRVTLGLRGRLGAPVRDFPLPLPTRAVAAPHLLDFSGGLFEPTRQATPQQILQVLRQASGGSLQSQWELFSLMEDTWPRLAKNLGEVRRAASRASYIVHAAAPESGTDTEAKEAAAEARRQLVERTIGSWLPRTGSLELGFEDTLFHALDALGKGLSVVSLRWCQKADGTVLPAAGTLLGPASYGWNPSGTELGFATEGVWRPFGAGEALCGVWQVRSGAPGATALLRPLTPYWLGSLFGWRWLMANAQLFGVPFRWATYRREDANIRDQLAEMLGSMGASGYAAFPEGTDVKFLESGKTSQDNPQVIIQTLADRACDLLILGQELSGEAQAAGMGSGASGLQASVRADRLAAAASWCADLLNYQLLPPLLEANFGNIDFMPIVLADVDAREDAKAMADRDAVLLGAGVPLPKAWLYERHGIPAPNEGEETIGGTPPAQPLSLPFSTQPNTAGITPTFAQASPARAAVESISTGEQTPDPDQELKTLLADVKREARERLADNTLAARIGAAASAAAKAAFEEEEATNAQN